MYLKDLKRFITIYSHMHNTVQLTINNKIDLVIIRKKEICHLICL